MATEPVRRPDELRVVPGIDRYEVAIPEAYALTQDRVRWGPIWGGFFTAVTSLILLSLLGVTVGLAALDVRTAAATDALPSGTGMAAALWGALSIIVAFFLGGFAAGRTAAVFDRRWGAWNGAIVFLMGLPIILLLASMGLGGLLGTLGSFVTTQATAVQNAAQSLQPGQIPNVQPADVASTAQAARNTAGVMFVGSLLALGASILGGVVATRRTITLDRALPEMSEIRDR